MGGQETCSQGLDTSTTTDALMAGGGAWEAEVSGEIAAGEGPVLRALGGYLRSLKTAAEGGGGGEEAAAAAAGRCRRCGAV